MLSEHDAKDGPVKDPSFASPFCRAGIVAAAPGLVVVSTRAGSRGSPRLLKADNPSRPFCFNSRGLPREPAIPRKIPASRPRILGFNSRGLPREPAIPPRDGGSLCRGCFNSRGLPREPAIAAPAKPSPTHLVSTRAGSRGSPRYDGVDRVSRIDRFQLARAPEGARDSEHGVLDVRALHGFNSRGLPREPAMSRSLRCVDSSVFQLARAPEGARDLMIRFMCRLRCVSTRAGSRGSPRFLSLESTRRTRGVSTRAGSRGSPRCSRSSI